MTTEKLQKAREAIVGLTKQFDRVNGYTKVAVKDDADPRLQELAEVVQELGGCNEEKLRKYTELILKVSLPAPVKPKGGSNIRFIRGAMIVVVTSGENSNSHNYPVGEPVLIFFAEMSVRAHAVRMNAREGNWLPEQRKHVRPATEQEIDRFLGTASVSDLEMYYDIAISQSKESLASATT